MVVLSLALAGAIVWFVLGLASALTKIDERWPKSVSRLIRWVGLLTFVSVYSALVVFVMDELGII